MGHSSKLISGTILVLISTTILLSFTAILSIWEIMAGDVLWKSLESIVSVLVGAVLVLIAAEPQRAFRVSSDKGLAAWIIVIILVLWVLGWLL